MTFVPIGFAVVAFVTLLFIRKRVTEYTLVVSEGVDPEVTSIQANSSNYGSINSNSNENFDEEKKTLSPVRSRPSFIVGSMPDSSPYNS